MLRIPNSDGKSKIVNHGGLSHIDGHSNSTNSIFQKEILKDPNKIAFENSQQRRDDLSFDQHSKPFIRNIFNGSFDNPFLNKPNKFIFNRNHHLAYIKSPKDPDINEESSPKTTTFQSMQNTENNNSNMPDIDDMFDHIESDNDISRFDRFYDPFFYDDFNEPAIEPQFNEPTIEHENNNAEKGNLGGKSFHTNHVALTAGEQDFKFMYYHIFVSRKKFQKKFVKEIHRYMQGPLNLPKMKREHERNIDLYFQAYYHLRDKMLVFLENNKINILKKIPGLSNFQKK